MSMMRRRPTMSMYLRATRVKMKFVPETMRPTAVGWSKPIWAKSVAEKYLEDKKVRNGDMASQEAAVHKGIEARQLLEGLHAASDN